MQFALLTERIERLPLVEAVDSAQWVKLASLRKALRELGAREEHIDVLGSSYFRLPDGRRLRVSDHGAMHPWSRADLYASTQQDYHRGESLKDKVFELWKHDDWGKAVRSFIRETPGQQKHEVIIHVSKSEEKHTLDPCQALINWVNGETFVSRLSPQEHVSVLSSQPHSKSGGLLYRFVRMIPRQIKALSNGHKVTIKEQVTTSWCRHVDSVIEFLNQAMRRSGHMDGAIISREIENAEVLFDVKALAKQLSCTGGVYRDPKDIDEVVVKAKSLHVIHPKDVVYMVSVDVPWGERAKVKLTNADNMQASGK